MGWGRERSASAGPYRAAGPAICWTQIPVGRSRHRATTRGGGSGRTTPNGYGPAQISGGPERLVGHGYTPVSEQVLDVSKAQREPVIEPDGVADNLRWEAMTTVVRLTAVHPGILSERRSSCQYC